VLTPEIIGHRGARGERPENTLEAILHSLSLGLRAVEIDVHLTADDEIAVTHDPLLDADLARDPEVGWQDTPGPNIRLSRHADLARFDVGRARPGSAKAAAFPGQVPVPKARIPRLEDVLDCCIRAGPVRLFVEVKSDPRDTEGAAAARRCARAVCDRLVGHPLGASAMLLSFDWTVLSEARMHAPRISRGHLTKVGGAGEGAPTFFSESPWLDGPLTGSPQEMIAARAGQVWAPHYGDLDRAAVAAAHAAGLEVIAWTVNARSDIAAVAQLGVDGIITDQPTLALSVLAETDVDGSKL
jgi:glycerophosphoryl diester phosphodiesterase